MQTECHSCASRYEIPDERVEDGGTLIRCPRCRGIMMVRREMPVEVVGAASEVALAPSIAEDAPTKPEGLPVALLREKLPADEITKKFEGLADAARRRQDRHLQAEAVARVVTQTPVEVAPIPLLQTKVRATRPTVQLKKPSAASVVARDCLAAVLGFGVTGLVFAAVWLAIQWS